MDGRVNLLTKRGPPRPEEGISARDRHAILRANGGVPMADMSVAVPDTTAPVPAIGDDLCTTPAL